MQSAAKTRPALLTVRDKASPYPRIDACASHYINSYTTAGRRCRSPNTTTWSKHSRRIEPIALSQYPFCHGDRGAVGRFPNAHRPKAADEDVTVDGVAVTNDVSRRATFQP